jgi:hypothetical protein
MSLQRAENLVQLFNNGEYDDDIEPYFNTLLNFFKFLKKYDVLDEIDLDNIPSREFDEEIFEYLLENNILRNLNYDTVPNEFKNYYLLHGLENNYQDTIKYITDDLITDVEIRDDGFYLYLKDREELANFFCHNSRDSSPEDIAKKVLNDDSFEWYYNNSIKPSEVIDELDESNIDRLKNRIYKEIGNKPMDLGDYNSDFFEFLSEEQGTPDSFMITSEDLTDLVKNSDAMKELFKDELSELGGDIANAYSNAESNAYESEVYNLVMNGLDEFFEGKIDYVSREVTAYDGTKKTRNFEYIKIRNFPNVIKKFLENRKGDEYSNSFLEYFGSYTDLMKEMTYNDEVDCISFRIPDYADWSLTQKYFNEIVTDYI